ncbi:MAG: PAS domain S-box protein [Sterolibacterium sp.]|jgi:diguanylate cyclase (GGDEF)-like protein/PAS domain S-box-containing protein
MIAKAARAEALPPDFRTYLAITVCLAALWVIAAWFITDEHRHRQAAAVIAAETKNAEHLGASLKLGVEHILSLRKGIAVTLAQEQLIREFVLARGPRKADAVNGFLATASRQLELDALWLGDADGYGIATDIPGLPHSPIGHNYADRVYFREARAGHVGYQYAYGKTTRIGGIFLSAPVMDEKRFAGFVVLKVNTSALSVWLDQANAILTDGNGVIIAATDPGLVMLALPDAKVIGLNADERRRQYGGTDFQRLQIAPWDESRYPEMRRVGESECPVLLYSKALPGFGLTLTVMQPVSQLAAIDHGRNVLFPLAAAVGVLIIAIVAAALAYLKYVQYSRGLLQRQYAFQQRIIDSIPGAFYLLDDCGRFLIWNRNLETVLGRTAEEVSRSDPLDFFDEQDKSLVENTIREVFETGAGAVEACFVAKDGKRIPYCFNGFRIDLDGEPTLIGVGIDITRQAAAEATVRKLNADLSATLQAIPDSLFDLDRNGTFLGIWAQTPALLPHSKESLLGHGVAEMLPPEAAVVMMAAIGEADDKGYSFGRTICLDLAGAKRWFELSTSKKAAADGSVARFIMLSRDVTERKQGELALVESERRFRDLFENNGSAMLLIDPDSGLIVDANQAAATYYGYSTARLMGMLISDINTRPPEEIAEERGRALREERNYFHFSHRLASGEVRDVEVYSTPIQVGATPLLLSVIHDITQRKKAEAQLRLAASVFANTNEGIVITDADNLIVDVNPGFTDITGYTRAEVIGRNPRLLASGRQAPEFYTEMWQSLREHDFWRGELWNRRKNSEVYAEIISISAVRDEAGSLQHYIGVFSDINRIKKHEDELVRFAHYDVLTGVPNRRLFADRLGQALARVHRSGKPLAVCYLDLDAFKPVNDEHGHRAGDQLLIMLTDRLQGLLRANDTIARLGGDEFALILTDLPHPEDCSLLLDRIQAAICAPVTLDVAVVSVSASIGVTLCPPDVSDGAVLLRHADWAMYRAKEAGKNRYHVFDPARDQESCASGS